MLSAVESNNARLSRLVEFRVVTLSDWFGKFRVAFSTNHIKGKTNPNLRVHAFYSRLAIGFEL